jgi:hypothetical protein
MEKNSSRTGAAIGGAITPLAAPIGADKGKRFRSFLGAAVGGGITGIGAMVLNRKNIFKTIEPFIAKLTEEAPKSQSLAKTLISSYTSPEGEAYLKAIRPLTIASSVGSAVGAALAHGPSKKLTKKAEMLLEKLAGKEFRKVNKQLRDYYRKAKGTAPSTKDYERAVLKDYEHAKKTLLPKSIGTFATLGAIGGALGTGKILPTLGMAGLGAAGGAGVAPIVKTLIKRKEEIYPEIMKNVGKLRYEANVAKEKKLSAERFAAK